MLCREDETDVEAKTRQARLQLITSYIQTSNIDTSKVRLHQSCSERAIYTNLYRAEPQTLSLPLITKTNEAKWLAVMDRKQTITFNQMSERQRQLTQLIERQKQSIKRVKSERQYKAHASYKHHKVRQD